MASTRQQMVGADRGCRRRCACTLEQGPTSEAHDSMPPAHEMPAFPAAPAAPQTPPPTLQPRSPAPEAGRRRQHWWAWLPWALDCLQCIALAPAPASSRLAAGRQQASSRPAAGLRGHVCTARPSHAARTRARWEGVSTTSRRCAWCTEDTQVDAWICGAKFGGPAARSLQRMGVPRGAASPGCRGAWAAADRLASAARMQRPNPALSTDRRCRKPCRRGSPPQRTVTSLYVRRTAWRGSGRCCSCTWMARVWGREERADAWQQAGSIQSCEPLQRTDGGAQGAQALRAPLPLPPAP